MPRVTINEKNGEHPFGDTGQLILFTLFMIVWVSDSFFLHLSTFPSSYIPLHIRLAILVFLIIITGYLFAAGHTVTDHENRSEGVVSNGAFRYVRHPLYLGSLLIYLGLAVSTGSLISLGLIVVIMFVFYNYIATYEEMFLEQKYGEAYRRYRKGTGKWLPKIAGGRRIWARYKPKSGRV